ncbi:MAG: restriction endonuclease subunit S [Candidatus Gracilibacteria bacterium]|nr:restriction endonuclease subunit S [Candidatus Gracilibacteria bacterium]
MGWKTVKIGKFLIERKEKYSPEQANSLNMPRLEKIDFSGRFHIAESKKTGTGMICIKPSDLVISGINVEKGALGIYEGESDILATIHYSSYEYDKNQIDIDYLRWFARSSEFKRILREQVGGGIKTEIKPKKFLSLEISLPDIEEQRSIVQSILSVQEDINKVNSLNNKNTGFVANLRSSILQDAIQGKLVPQDSSDEPANVLLDRIQKEKEELVKSGKIKKQKELSPIKSEEIPFELPKGWEWVRLGELLLLSEYGSAEKANTDESGVPMFRMGNVQKGSLTYDDFKYLNRKAKDLPKLYLKKNDLLFNRTNSWELVGKTGIFLGDDDSYTFAGYLIRLRSSFLISPIFINYYLNSDFFRKTQIEPQIIQQCGQANFSGGKLVETLCPLPPASEQLHIVEKVSELFTYCDVLESSTKDASEASEKLLESVLAKVFNP